MGFELEPLFYEESNLDESENGILLENIESDDVEKIIMYYENKKKTGGGEIKKKNYYPDNKNLIIIYKDEQTVKSVLDFGEVKIDKYLFKPQLFENNISKRSNQIFKLHFKFYFGF